MPTDGDLLCRSRSPLTWRHGDLAANASYAKQRVGSLSIEFTMQPQNEIGGRRLGKSSRRAHPVHFSLDPHMGASLQLKVATLFVAIEFACERTFDIAGARIVAFNQIAVVRIHHANEVRKRCRGSRVKRTTQSCRRGRKISGEVSDQFRRVLEAGRLDPLHALKRAP